MTDELQQAKVINRAAANTSEKEIAQLKSQLEDRDIEIEQLQADQEANEDEIQMVLKTMKEMEDRCESMTSHLAEKYNDLMLKNATLNREKNILQEQNVQQEDRYIQMNMALQKRVAELETINNELISDLNDTATKLDEKSTSLGCDEMLEMVESGFSHMLEIKEKEIDSMKQHMDQKDKEIQSTVEILQQLQGLCSVPAKPRKRSLLDKILRRNKPTTDEFGESTAKLIFFGARLRDILEKHAPL